jgi:hypothetical protein
MSLRPFFDAPTNLYWVLKGRTDQGIPDKPQQGQTFTLIKQALFNYPVGQVLLVCNDDFEALAYAKVLSVEQLEGTTRVLAQIVKTLEPHEQTALTHHLQTTARIMEIL